MRLLVIPCFLLLVLGSWVNASAADISGKWTAQAMAGAGGAEQKSPATFTFRIEDGALTGSLENQYGTFGILDGKVEGETVTFRVVMTGASPAEVLYDGLVTEEGLDFIATFVGRGRSDEFVATRADE